MRSFTKIAVIVAVTVALGFGAYAELQNVLVSGSLRIRGNYLGVDGARVTPTALPLPTGTLRHRLFDATAPLGFGAAGRWRLFGGYTPPGQELDDLAFVEQRTRLGVRADFTDNVSAMIELDSYDIWGEDFRSDYVTGVDGRAVSTDDVEIYQGYIEASEMWDTPVRLRVGRQEMVLGSGWLVGNNDANSGFTGLSFDAVRATYETDMVSVDVFGAKLAETLDDFGDGDVDFYGVYGSYMGLEDITIDAYWLYLRDDEAVVANPYMAGLGDPGSWLSRIVWPLAGFFSTAENTDVHTIGLRGAGLVGAFDFEAEVAYQFGEIEMNSPRPLLFWDIDLNSELEYGELAANLEVGYTFDMNWSPRAYLGFAYFGADNDGAQPTFWETVFLGFTRYPYSDSLAFNRLFSNWEYSKFLDNTTLSNSMVIRGGVDAQPTEAVNVGLDVAYFQALDESYLDRTQINYGILSPVILPFVALPWWRWESQDESLGIETHLHAEYSYTDDLVFRAGWAHFFTDDGMDKGTHFVLNGLGTLSADGDDFDYLYLESEIKF